MHTHTDTNTHRPRHRHTQTISTSVSIVIFYMKQIRFNSIQFNLTKKHSLTHTEVKTKKEDEGKDEEMLNSNAIQISVRM